MRGYQYNIAQSNVPQQVTGLPVPSFFADLKILGIKGFVASGYPLNNAGQVNFGFKSGECPIPVTTGQYFTLVNRRDEIGVLDNLWIVGSQGDGLYIIY